MYVEQEQRVAEQLHGLGSRPTYEYSLLHSNGPLSVVSVCFAPLPL